VLRPPQVQQQPDSPLCPLVADRLRRFAHDADGRTPLKAAGELRFEAGESALIAGFTPGGREPRRSLPRRRVARAETAGDFGARTGPRMWAIITLCKDANEPHSRARDRRLFAPVMPPPRRGAVPIPKPRSSLPSAPMNTAASADRITRLRTAPKRAPRRLSLPPLF
jgi:hypothetical protein